jgi:hypothetical protein
MRMHRVIDDIYLFTELIDDLIIFELVTGSIIIIFLYVLSRLIGKNFIDE